MTARLGSARRLTFAVSLALGCIALALTAGPASTQSATKALRATGTAACRPSDLSATIVITPVGGSSSSLAGAIVFANRSSTACALRGVPKVTAVDPAGKTIDVRQVPDFVRHKPQVILPASPSSARLADAGTSVTWSNWSCAKNSFALVVKFAGWSAPLTVPWGSTTGYAGAACVGGSAALYIGPVTRVAAPSPAA